MKQQLITTISYVLVLCSGFTFGQGGNTDVNPSRTSSQEASWGYSDFDGDVIKTINGLNSEGAVTNQVKHKLTSAYLYIALDFGSQYVSKETDNSDFTINLTVQYTLNGQAATTTIAVTDKQPESLVRLDLTNNFTSNPDIEEISLQVTGFEEQITGSFITNYINERLQLHAWLERKFDVDVRLESNLMSQAPYSLSYVPQNKLHTFQWEIPQDVYYPNYEIQILRLHNINPSKSTDRRDIDYEVNWDHALKVETHSFHKQIALTLMEGSGYYTWRVRPIGTFNKGGIANSENYGLWSSGLAQGHSGSLTNYVGDPTIFYYEDAEENLNWIYTRVFSEGNKDMEKGVRVSEGLSYADGLHRVKQTQMFNSEDRRTLVSQSVPDFMGRAALGTIPVPLETPEGLNGYRPNFVQNEEGVVYTAFDFDYYDSSSPDGPIYENIQNPSKIRDDGDFAYYNGTNNEGVANTEGYSFSRTLFKTDGTNRVSEISGVGRVHALGTITEGENRTTRILYSSVSDNELLRIFGDEAPLAESVIKTITIDPNGARSIAYTSKEGKTIATALISNETSNLLKLNENDHQFNVQHSTEQSIANTKGYHSSKRIALSEEKEVTLGYTYTINSGCVDCSYAVQFYLIDLKNQVTYVSDEDGFTGSPTEPNAIKPFEFNGTGDLSFGENWAWINEDNNSVSDIVISETNKFTLPEGEYILVKHVYSLATEEDSDLMIAERILSVIFDQMRGVQNISDIVDFNSFVQSVMAGDFGVLNSVLPDGAIPFTSIPSGFKLEFTPSLTGIGDISFSINEDDAENGCPSCATNPVNTFVPENCRTCVKIQEVLEQAVGPIEIGSDDWNTIHTFVRNGDPDNEDVDDSLIDGFIEYLRQNELYQDAVGEGNPNEYLDLIAPGFTFDKFAFMLTNMLVSKYYTGYTLNGYMAVLDEEGNLNYCDGNGEILENQDQGILPISNTYNYDCRELYTCWITSVALLEKVPFENNVNIMNGYNDEAETDSEDEFDDEDNRDEGGNWLTDLVLSRKMRKFNDSDEGIVKPSVLNNKINFINNFMTCAGYQFAAILDEQYITDKGMDSPHPTHEYFMFNESTPNFYASKDTKRGNSFSTVAVPDNKAFYVGSYVEDEEDNTMNFEFERISCGFNLSAGTFYPKNILAYPYILRPEWMFKYYVYNAFGGLRNNGIVDDNDKDLDIVTQPSVEYAMCYNNFTGIPADNSCKKCTYFHENWSSDERLSFYRFISAGSICPEVLLKEDDLDGIFFTSYQDDFGEDINPREIATEQLDEARNTCTSRQGEFQSAIVRELQAMCYEIVECVSVSPSPYEVSMNDVSLMADEVVNACISSVDAIGTALKNNEGEYGIGATDYPYQETIGCSQFIMRKGESRETWEYWQSSSTTTLHLFPVCDQMVLNQVRNWELNIRIEPASGCDKEPKLLEEENCDGTPSPTSGASLSEIRNVSADSMNN